MQLLAEVTRKIKKHIWLKIFHKSAMMDLNLIKWRLEWRVL